MSLKYNPLHTKSYRKDNNGLLRPTFFNNGEELKENEIRAGGVIFYTYINKKLHILLIKKTETNIYEDFGGKTDMLDLTILDTISREVEEESNKIFSKENIKKRLENNIKNNIYYRKSKYKIYFLEISNIDCKLFGIKEIHDNIPRTVHWISYDDFIDLKINNKINPRLHSNYIDMQLNYFMYLNEKKNITLGLEKLKINSKPKYKIKNKKNK